MIIAEIVIVVLVTFGASGMRSVLQLIHALLAEPALNAQTTTLTAPRADAAWLDLGLQLVGASVLCGWVLLVVYLLARDRIRLPRWRPSDLAVGTGLAAAIGLPGLGLYLVALHVGWTKEVIPSAYEGGLVAVVVLLVWSFANAWAEETVVVWWFSTRLAQLRVHAGWIVAASALLRGSYHLYQGPSAGVGNIVMGVVMAAYYARYRRVWPLVVAHFLIDATAFVSYQFLDLSWLGVH